MWKFEDLLIAIALCAFAFLSVYYRWPVTVINRILTIEKGEDKYLKCTHFKGKTYMFEVSLSRMMKVGNKKMRLDELTVGKTLRIMSVARTTQVRPGRYQVRVGYWYTRVCLHGKHCNNRHGNIVLPVSSQMELLYSQHRTDLRIGQIDFTLVMFSNGGIKNGSQVQLEFSFSKPARYTTSRNKWQVRDDDSDIKYYEPEILKFRCKAK